MKARVSADGAEVILEGDLWTGRFPVSDLEEWIAFYSRLAERKGGKYRPHYEPTVTALTRLRAEGARHEG